eukprot:364460-Chlamydomonas_euryale.AAC.5
MPLRSRLQAKPPCTLSALCTHVRRPPLVLPMHERRSRLPGKLARMLASRAMMVCAAYQSESGRHMSTNHVLMRAHFEVRGCCEHVSGVGLR